MKTFTGTVQFNQIEEFISRIISFTDEYGTVFVRTWDLMVDDNPASWIMIDSNNDNLILDQPAFEKLLRQSEFDKDGNSTLDVVVCIDDSY